MAASFTYYAKTQALIKLYVNVSDENRDARLEQTEQLLTQREELLKLMIPPYSQEEQLYFEKLKSLEQQLHTLLQTEKLAIRENIKQLFQRKETTNKYMHPYDNLNTDGLFYDKRN